MNSERHAQTPGGSDTASLLVRLRTAHPRQAAERARDVLDRDSRNVEALVALAGHSETIAEALALLHQAVRFGRGEWAEALSWRQPVRHLSYRSLRRPPEQASTGA